MNHNVISHTSSMTILTNASKLESRCSFVSETYNT